MSGEWPFPKPLDDGAADHLQAGVRLPELELPASNGEYLAPWCFRGLCVLFIYPYTGRPGLSDPPGWDDIPGAHGSTPEIENFSRLYEEFQTKGVSVFGVSSQERPHHLELIERLELPFLLLSDCGFAFQAALDLPTFCAGNTRYLKRLTLVLEDGQVLKTFYPIHPPDEHPQRVLDWIKRC